ncbi:MAG: 50S ribosomal protein L35 [Nitrospinota bacterium]|nr:MAG: 50S ribosomal protein L35 [Nitrospinota bacterium]
MPKMKTNKGAAKRFSLTGRGKVKRYKAGKNHILTKKPRKRKRRLRQHTVLSGVDAQRVVKLLPYG